MPSVIAILRTESLEVEPGRDAETVLTVHNTGSIVEQFSVEVIGDAAPWATVEPTALSLFPNTQQDVTIWFRTPREWHIAPGSVPFGVKVVPSNDPDGSVVEEGHLELGSYQEISAELIPAVITGKRRAKLGIAIDSTSNVAVPATLRGRDPSDTLVMTVKPRQIVLQPGTTTFAKMIVAPRKRYLRGPEKQARFKVGVEPDEGEPILLDATLVQRPLMPKGSFTGLAIIAILAGWFLVIRPTVKNAAVSAVQPAIQTSAKQSQSVSAQLKNTQSQVNQVKKKVTQVSTAQNQRGGAAAGATTSTSTTTTTTTPATSTSSATSNSSNSSSSSSSTTSSSTTTTTSATSTSTTTTLAPTSGPQLTIGDYSDSLPVVAAAGSSQQQTLVIPAGQVFQLTDIIMQNENASEGSSLQVGLLQPGATSTEFIFLMNLSSTTPQDFSLKTPINFPAGSTLVASVTCAGGGTQPCSTAVLVDGTVNDT